MNTRRNLLGRLLLAGALVASFAIGVSAIVTVAAAPCLEPSKGKGPKCPDLLCGPCEQLACGGKGRCDFVCVPVPGCVP